ncbi:hypothetical protein AKJ16_DCAP12270 [Drosera capensis]
MELEVYHTKFPNASLWVMTPTPDASLAENLTRLSEQFGSHEMLGPSGSPNSLRIDYVSLEELYVTGLDFSQPVRHSSYSHLRSSSA